MTIECLELISYQFVLENNVTIFENTQCHRGIVLLAAQQLHSLLTSFQSLFG